MGMHGLSFDVEDYEAIVARDWFGLERPPGYRCVEMTRLVLSELQKTRTQATFFVLGTVAEAFPDLVRRIHAEGHEVGTHGYSHRKCFDQTPEEFRADVERALAAIRKTCPDACVRGFRAPAFSVTRRSLWAPQVLKDLGLEYESSIFPLKAPRYGIAGAPRGAFRHPCGLIEVPLSTVRWLGRRWPVCGGGYLRLPPYALTRWALSRLRREGLAGVIYMHPYEFDAAAPKLDLDAGRKSGGRRFRRFDRLQRMGRGTCLPKLRKLLCECQLAPIYKLVQAIGAGAPTADLEASKGRA